MCFQFTNSIYWGNKNKARPWTSSMDLVHKGLHGPGFMFCTFPFPRASKILECKLEFNLICGKYSCWMIAWNLLHLLSILIRGRKIEFLRSWIVWRIMASPSERPQNRCFRAENVHKSKWRITLCIKDDHTISHTLRSAITFFYQSFSAISNSINSVHKFVSVRKTNEFARRIKWTKRHAVKKIGPFGIHMLVVNISDPFLQGRQKSIHKVVSKI